MKDIKKREMLGVLMGAGAFVAAPTIAQTLSDQIREEPTWVTASGWARENPTVLVFAADLGENVNFGAEDFEAYLEQGFRQFFNIDVVAFVEETGRAGSVISYHYGVHSSEFEPLQTGTTAERFQKIADEFRAYQVAVLGVENE